MVVVLVLLVLLVPAAEPEPGIAALGVEVALFAAPGLAALALALAFGKRRHAN
jgi:hypothetical protein